MIKSYIALRHGSDKEFVVEFLHEKAFRNLGSGFVGLQFKELKWVKKKIRHKISIQLYNKCKDYYKPVNVPTTIVYFDEVRKGKKKEKVGIVKWKSF